MKISQISQVSHITTLTLITLTLTCSLGRAHYIPITHLPKRSLPGSLAVAPAGAVGYYAPPPGPKPVHEEIDIAPTTTALAISHELRNDPVGTGSAGIGNDGARLKNTAAVTVANSVRETLGVSPVSSMAMSGRDIGWWTMMMRVGLSFWMLVSLALF